MVRESINVLMPPYGYHKGSLQTVSCDQYGPFFKGEGTILMSLYNICILKLKILILFVLLCTYKCLQVSANYSVKNNYGY